MAAFRKLEGPFHLYRAYLSTTSSVFCNSKRPLLTPKLLTPNVCTFHYNILKASFSHKRELDSLTYDKISEETLDELACYFEELPDKGVCHPDYDVQFSGGVLTISLGGDMGTYVINKQAPNKQIWLASPISGPKRFDLIDDKWRYTRDNSCLHELLAVEIGRLLSSTIDLSSLNYFKIPEDNS